MKRLLLVGGGHAHALLLAGWRRQPLPGVALTLVSPDRHSAYSGMVPGWLAGAYTAQALQLDLPALCQAAGAQWCPGELEALDPASRQLRLATGEWLAYDLLSLDIGATLAATLPPGPALLPLRPLARLLQDWPRVRARWAAEPARPLRLSCVGGGAAGFEALLAVLAALRRDAPQRLLSARLLTRSDALLPGFPAASQRAARQALARAGVSLCLGVDDAGAQVLQDDLVLWATGAQAQAWQRDPARRAGLAVDGEGFVAVNARLQSTSHPEVFATGDCAGWPGGLPKAGVHAVRQAPVLDHNLRAALTGQPLQAYRPQRHFLTLLATGDGRAIASRGRFGAEGRWAWRWKDRIDRRFMARFPSPSAQDP